MNNNMKYSEKPPQSKTELNYKQANKVNSFDHFSDTSPVQDSQISFMMVTHQDIEDMVDKEKMSVLNLLSFLFLLIVTILLFISLVSPYWAGFLEPWIERMMVPKQYQLDPEAHNAWVGLYTSCSTDYSCFNGCFLDKNGWFVACQILYATGFSVIVFSFITQCVYMCCRSCISCFPTHKLIFIVALALLIGAILCSIGLAIFGINFIQDGYMLPMVLNGKGGYFSWAFVLGIIGVALGGFNALFFLVDAFVQTQKVNELGSPAASFITSPSNDIRNGLRANEITSSI